MQVLAAAGVMPIVIVVAVVVAFAGQVAAITEASRYCQVRNYCCLSGVALGLIGTSRKHHLRKDLPEVAMLTTAEVATVIVGATRVRVRS